VLKKTLIVSAAVLCLGASLASQTPSNAAQESRATTTASTSGPNLHLEGCVFPERALTSATPVPVPAGSVDRYVLTNTKIIAGSDATEGSMFKLDEVAQDRLRDLSGKRVGVTGRSEGASDGAALRVTSIREIVGTCPPTPRS
jgi:hypothetical protein